MMSAANVHLSCIPRYQHVISCTVFDGLDSLNMRYMGYMRYMFLHDIFSTSVCSISSKIHLLLGTEDYWFGLNPLVCLIY